MSKIQNISPSPHGHFLLGHLLHYRKDPLGYFLQSALKYGDLVRFRMVHRPLFLIVGPSYIRHILQGNARNYVKGISYESLKLLLGDGLLVSEGDLWRRQRRLMQPAFTRQALMPKTNIMVESTAAMIERWRLYAQSGQAFDLVPEMMRLAFDIVGKTLFGTDISGEMRDVEATLTDAVAYVWDQMQAPFKLPATLPTKRKRRFRQCMRTLDGVVARVIAKHRSTENDNRSLLSILMQARDEETGQGMSDQQLRDEVLTLMLTGHETTGDALAWTWYLLCQHPEIEQRLHVELDEVLGGRTPTAEDLARLQYTDQIVSESMRIYPPAWSFTRSALADDRIDDHLIPAGSIIVISPYVNQRLPKFWPNPEKFDPDRFTPERVKEQLPYTYFPFGGGPHTCIGKHLSLFEVKVAVAMIAQTYRLQLVPEQTVVAEAGITLRPQPGIMVTVHER